METKREGGILGHKQLLVNPGVPLTRDGRGRQYLMMMVLVIVTIIWLTSSPTFTASFSLDILSIIKTVEESSPLCPQSSPLSPDAHGDLFNSLESLYSTDSFKLHAYESLGGAVRIP